MIRMIERQYCGFWRNLPRVSSVITCGLALLLSGCSHYNWERDWGDYVPDERPSTTFPSESVA